jgi:hypothetical protein
MKITIPKIILPVEMTDYSPELAGKFLFVWVNPPREMLAQYDELVNELQTKELENARRTLFPAEQPKAESSGLQQTFDTLKHWLHIKAETKPEGIDEKLLRWYAEVWSQGPEDSRWTVAELRELEMQDPAFLSWMIAETWQTRNEHVQRKKKV